MNTKIKLHLGCGTIHKDEYINIDIRNTPAVDMIADIKKLPFENNSVDLIESYHLIEHLKRNEIGKVLTHWLDILVKGGKLIIECPDFKQDCIDFINGNNNRLNNIFGLQRNEYDFHYFGYTPESLSVLLKNIGFNDITICEPLDYHKNTEPCLRIEAIKKREQK